MVQPNVWTHSHSGVTWTGHVRPPVLNTMVKGSKADGRASAPCTHYSCSMHPPLLASSPQAHRSDWPGQAEQDFYGFCDGMCQNPSLQHHSSRLTELTFSCPSPLPGMAIILPFSTAETVMRFRQSFLTKLQFIYQKHNKTKTFSLEIWIEFCESSSPSFSRMASI